MWGHDVTATRPDIVDRYDSQLLSAVQSKVVHDLHTSESCTSIIIHKRICTRTVYPAQYLFGLLSRRCALGDTLAVQDVYDIAAGTQPQYGVRCVGVRDHASSRPVYGYGYVPVLPGDTYDVRRLLDVNRLVVLVMRRELCILQVTKNKRTGGGIKRPPEDFVVQLQLPVVLHLVQNA